MGRKLGIFPPWPCCPSHTTLLLPALKPSRGHRELLMTSAPSLILSLFILLSFRSRCHLARAFPTFYTTHERLLNASLTQWRSRTAEGWQVIWPSELGTAFLPQTSEAIRPSGGSTLVGSPILPAAMASWHAPITCLHLCSSKACLVGMFYIAINCRGTW